MSEPLRSVPQDSPVAFSRTTARPQPERPAAESSARWPAATRPEPLLRLVIHKGSRRIVVRLDEVDWIEGAGNYVRVHLQRESHLHRQTLAELHARLDPRRFARIHRSAIVRLDAIAEIDGRGAGRGRDGADRGASCEVELRHGARLAVSRRYRRELLTRLGAE